MLTDPNCTALATSYLAKVECEVDDADIGDLSREIQLLCEEFCNNLEAERREEDADEGR